MRNILYILMIILVLSCSKHTKQILKTKSIESTHEIIDSVSLINRFLQKNENTKINILKITPDSTNVNKENRIIFIPDFTKEISLDLSGIKSIEIISIEQNKSMLDTTSIHNETSIETTSNKTEDNYKKEIEKRRFGRSLPFYFAIIIIILILVFQKRIRGLKLWQK